MPQLRHGKSYILEVWEEFPIENTDNYKNRNGRKRKYDDTLVNNIDNAIPVLDISPKDKTMISKIEKVLSIKKLIEIRDGLTIDLKSECDSFISEGQHTKLSSLSTDGDAFINKSTRNLCDNIIRRIDAIASMIVMFRELREKLDRSTSEFEDDNMQSYHKLVRRIYEILHEQLGIPSICGEQVEQSSIFENSIAFFTNTLICDYRDYIISTNKNGLTDRQQQSSSSTSHDSRIVDHFKTIEILIEFVLHSYDEAANCDDFYQEILNKKAIKQRVKLTSFRMIFICSLMNSIQRGSPIPKIPLFDDDSDSPGSIYQSTIEMIFQYYEGGYGKIYESDGDMINNRRLIRLSYFEVSLSSRLNWTSLFQSLKNDYDDLIIACTSSVCPLPLIIEANEHHKDIQTTNKEVMNIDNHAVVPLDADNVSNDTNNSDFSDIGKEIENYSDDMNTMNKLEHSANDNSSSSCDDIQQKKGEKEFDFLEEYQWTSDGKSKFTDKSPDNSDLPYELADMERHNDNDDDDDVIRKHKRTTEENVLLFKLDPEDRPFQDNISQKDLDTTTIESDRSIQKDYSPPCVNECDPILPNIVESHQLSSLSSVCQVIDKTNQSSPSLQDVIAQYGHNHNILYESNYKIERRNPSLNSTQSESSPNDQSKTDSCIDPTVTEVSEITDSNRKHRTNWAGLEQSKKISIESTSPVVISTNGLFLYPYQSTKTNQESTDTSRRLLKRKYATTLK